MQNGHHHHDVVNDNDNDNDENAADVLTEERPVSEQNGHSENNNHMNDTEMDTTFVPYRLAGGYLLSRLKEAGLSTPLLGIICGSGLSGLASTLTGKTLTIKYSEIPGFPSHCSVSGHKGELVFGELKGVQTICFRGRFHSYEGYDMKTVALPVTVMRCLGVRICILTNAAGGLNPQYKVGDVVCVADHLAIPQLAGKNPLIGKNDDELGPRFPATSNAYPEDLRRIALEAAQQLKFDFVQPEGGVYTFVSGPMYESKAECRFLRSLGGDAVGMSTVPEVVTAHHCDMKTLCLSLITNQVVTTDNHAGPIATHDEVLQAVEIRAAQMQTLVTEIVGLVKVKVLPKLPPLRSVSVLVSEQAKQNYLKTQEQQSNNSKTTSSSSTTRKRRNVSWSLAASTNNNTTNLSTTLSLSHLAIGCVAFAVGTAAGVLLSSKMTRSSSSSRHPSSNDSNNLP